MKRALLVLLLVAQTAHAEDPWETGVTADVQDKANAIFAQGNTLFAQLAHAAALDKYKAAIALWDHPMIRFNMAVTLIRLDRILEASDELERALLYGDKPFTTDLYEQARNYEVLIKKQLGYIHVTCTQPNTRISLDGKPWFESPGEKTMRVTIGEHTVVAEREGFLTATHTIVVAGSRTVNDPIELKPIDSVLVDKYRHPRWMPWTLAGAGAGVVLGGLVLSLVGQSDMDDFARHFTAECPTGCEADLSQHPNLADEKDRAQLKGRIGTSLMITGGAMVAGGVIWVILNRPKRVLPTVEAHPTQGGMTASVGWRF